MNNNFAKTLFTGLVIAFFIVSTIFIVGCAPKKIKVVYEKDDNSGYSEAGYKHKHKKKGPPAHAPAHGYRAKHKYRYYPSRSVYYDTDRRLYFYIKGENWEVKASLPSSIRVGLGDSVSIELDTDKPYIYHADHVKKIKVVYEKDGNSGYSEAGYKHKHKKKGPPAHAPAHGYRAKHQYRYYPSRSVYYDTGREIYFYLKGDNWEVRASLPGSIRVGLGDSVSIQLDTDKPYLYHADHVKKYPPGQMKKKKNKKKDKWGVLHYGLASCVVAILPPSWWKEGSHQTKS